METEFFYIHLAGLSRDQRTNQWSVRCKKCGNCFTPPTTMLAWQEIVCTRRGCTAVETVNYNNYKQK